MQELAIAHAPRCFVRVSSGPYNHKVVHFCSYLLYILTIRLAINDVAMSYSLRPALPCVLGDSRIPKQALELLSSPLN
jgi:hypothetical protein